MSTDEPMDALSAVTREAMQLRTRLTEATALLVEWDSEEPIGGIAQRKLKSDTKAFLSSRAPAQPAAPPPSSVELGQEFETCPMCDQALTQPAAPDLKFSPAAEAHLDALEAQPAAPTPEQAAGVNAIGDFYDVPAVPTPIEYPCKHGGECYCVPLCGTPEHKPVTSISDVLRQVFASELGETAAPEPSADYSRGYKEGSDDTSLTAQYASNAETRKALEFETDCLAAEKKAHEYTWQRKVLHIDERDTARAELAKAEARVNRASLLLDKCECPALSTQIQLWQLEAERG